MAFLKGGEVLRSVEVVLVVGGEDEVVQKGGIDSRK